MNYSDTRFTLDVQLHQAQVSVSATLNDTARRLCVGFTDGRKPYVIAEGCTATFAAKKPDGLALFNACTVENNTVIYEFTPQTTNVIGTYECEIRLYNEDGKQLTSPRFLLVVDEQAINDDDVIDSFTEVTMLNQIIANETERIVKENERIANEDTRNANEEERIANENNRIENENMRESAEQSRAGAEVSRVLAEENRVSKDQLRDSWEHLRQDSESVRQSAEADRMSNENTRISNENTRISKENEREQQEIARLNYEASRDMSEDQRVANENQRIANESARETRLQSVETKVSSIETKTNNLSNRTSAVESKANGLEISIENNAKSIASLQTKAQSLETGVQNNAKDIEANAEGIKALSTDVQGNMQGVQNNADQIGYINDYLNRSPSESENIFLDVYPIGSIYMSVNSTSPATLFGGTWTQLKDRFLIGTGSTYSNGATGGEATHTLTTAEMPRHSHYQTISNGSWAYDAVYSSGGANSSISGYYIDGSVIKSGKGGRANTEYVGGDGAHNNLPPYLAVYMWKRIA